MDGAGFRLEAGLSLGFFFLFVLKLRTMRVPFPSVGWEVGGGMFSTASVMVDCRDVMLTARGEGLFGRLTQAGPKMSRQCGAMERSFAFGHEIFDFRRRHSSVLFDESSVLRYLSA
jgi:hypothetical protein